MKVVSSVKPICKDCYHVRRGKTLYLRCRTQPRHKRRQGFSTFVQRDETHVCHGCCSRIEQHQPVVASMPTTQAMVPLALTSLSPMTQFWMRNGTNCLVGGKQLTEM